MSSTVHNLKLNNYAFSLHNEIDAIHDIWSQIAPQNIFFEIDYLRFIEKNPPAGMQSRYGIFYKDEVPTGILLLQVKHIALGESLKIEGEQSGNKLVNRTVNNVKKLLARKVKFNTLLVGNMMLTGEYGFHFTEKFDDYTTYYTLIDQALPIIRKELLLEDLKVSSVLMKDFYEEHAISKTPLKSKTNFAEYKVQPDMIMRLNEEWNSFDDYLSQLKSKYRVRTKRAMKKIADVEKRVLSLEEIKQHEEDIYQQYLQIAELAGFNLFILPKNYFSGLKSCLGDKFKLTAYFLKGKLIGYYTLIFNYKDVDAHYLGYDKAHNGVYQTYLNMLYDMIRDSIEASCHCIHFSRTALEIKSSVGAIPKEMVFYLRAEQSFQNKFVPGMLKLLTPIEKWVPRTPFKS